MKLNRVEKSKEFTHEGAKASSQTLEQKLRRTVLTTMLWEDGFYEDGESVTQRIENYVKKLPFTTVEQIALEAKNNMKLRHVPLLVAALAPKYFEGAKVGNLVEAVIQRPDEMGEIISIYWKLNGGGKMIPRQMKYGIARAFKKFNEYQLAKYDSSNASVKLRDVVFLCHIKAGKNAELGSRIARLVNKEKIPLKTKSGFQVRKEYSLKAKGPLGLASPETWENRLSRGEDKKTVFTELIQNNQLGAMALLRNLRGMKEAGVQSSLIAKAIGSARTDKVLPFRFLSAYRHAPEFRIELEQKMLECAKNLDKLEGQTVLLVDISGSMSSQISSKSDLTRLDAARGLAILLREIGEDVKVHAFDTRTDANLVQRGFELGDKLQIRGGTNIGQAVTYARTNYPKASRTIVITDEQSYSVVGKPAGKGYMINVANYQNGVSKSENWENISGFSEAIAQYIVELEKLD